MITRKNIIEYDVNEHEANELYFDDKILEEVEELNLDSVLEFMYRKNGISPLSMTWELTEHCNLDCPFCYIHNSKSDTKNEFNYRFKDIKKELDVLIREGLFICYITGGECLLHPDFKQIYLYLKKEGVLVVILTNATLMTDDHIQLFKKYKPYKIEISIYGMNSTFIHKDSTKISQRVIENILKLQQAGINVIAKMPYNKCTEKEFTKVYDWCKNHEIEFFYSEELFDSYDGTNNSVYQVEKIEENKSVKEEQKIGYKKIFDCSAGKYSFLLSYNKKIRPCFAFYEQKTPEWNFSIEKRGIFETFLFMKEKIRDISGKRLEYCKGCKKYKQCQECIATQCVVDNVEEYMKTKCRSI